MFNTIRSDLNFIVRENVHNYLFDKLKDKKIFITGGTGFFGKWLLYSLIHANNLLNTKIKIQVLSRNPDNFLNNNPYFSTRSDISFLKGDVSSFDLSQIDRDTNFIIHAATDASATLNKEFPEKMYSTIISGTNKIIKLGEYLKNNNKLEAILFTSSGAVYGASNNLVPAPFKEDITLSGNIVLPAIKDNAYMLGKIESEKLFTEFSQNQNIPVKIARCFAFVGPFLPLDGTYAIGNFINNVINKQDIVIKSDGSAVRSYMYASDLVIWLLKILLDGKNCYPYNVGSDKAISIKELANTFKTVFPESNIHVHTLSSSTTGAAPNVYLPCTDRAKLELGLKENVSLKEAILKTTSML